MFSLLFCFNFSKKCSVEFEITFNLISESDRFKNVSRFRPGVTPFKTTYAVSNDVICNIEGKRRVIAKVIIKSVIKIC